MAEKEYIDRGAILAYLNKVWEESDNWYEEDTPESPANMIEYVESIPAADVAPVVHAAWIPHEHVSRSPYARNYDCSACGNSPIETGDFCNKCGAKMDGGKAE